MTQKVGYRFHVTASQKRNGIKSCLDVYEYIGGALIETKLFRVSRGKGSARQYCKDNNILAYNF